MESKFNHPKGYDISQSKRVLQTEVVIYLHFQNQNKYLLEYLLSWPFCQMVRIRTFAMSPGGKATPSRTIAVNEQSALEISERVCSIGNSSAYCFSGFLFSWTPG